MSNLPNFPILRPSLLLDFANSKQVDPRITFTRASTATYYDAQGVLRTAASGVPRIDHDPVTGECKGLLIEEARTNLALNSTSVLDTWGSNSGQFDHVSIIGIDNTAVAPDGSVNGGTLSINAIDGRGTLICNDSTGKTKNNAVCASAFFKPAASITVQMTLVCQTAGSTFTYRSTVDFNLLAGTINEVSNVGIDGSTPSVTATITNVGNGWYRCSIAFSTYNGANALNALLAEIRPNSGQTSGSVYVWGRQLEVGAFPTSYIATSTAATTRAADAASMTGTNFSEWANSVGTILAKYKTAGWKHNNTPPVTQLDLTKSVDNYSTSRAGDSIERLIFYPRQLIADQIAALKD